MLELFKLKIMYNNGHNSPQFLHHNDIKKSNYDHSNVCIYSYNGSNVAVPVGCDVSIGPRWSLQCHGGV